MYADNFIDWAGRRLNNKNLVIDGDAQKVVKIARSLVSSIKESIKFKTPPLEEIIDSKKMSIENIIGNKDILLLPYSDCWFEFYHKTAGRVCYLLHQNSESLGYSYIYFTYDTEKRNWINDNLCHFVSYNDERQEVMWSAKNIYTGEEDCSYSESATRSRNYQLLYVSSILGLMGCKNVGTEDNYPPKKLNKKRVASGKLPLSSYKTLVIKPTGKRYESIPKHLWDNRIHLCRGHFKTYTEKNPLFGKYTGRYWWQPCVRGNKEKGVVMKDYVVETVQ